MIRRTRLEIQEELTKIIRNRRRIKKSKENRTKPIRTEKEQELKRHDKNIKKKKLEE